MVGSVSVKGRAKRRLKVPISATHDVLTNYAGGRTRLRLAENYVRVRKTSTAFHRFKDHGEDAITGKATKRRAVGIAISIWYDEPEASKRVRASPATWMFG
jgi:hypothetical protein